MTKRQGILVVDDTYAALQLLADVLSEEGYTVRPANTGERALASVEAEPPELILLDIRMPGMDGFEVCKRLKAMETARDIPVLFLSAATEMEERLLGFSLGAVDFITKPFQRDELLARVKTHLAIQRLQESLRRSNDEMEERVRQRTAELEVQTRALADSEERFRAVVQNSADLVTIHDGSGAIVYESPQVSRVLGRREGYMVGRSPVDIAHPEDAARLRQALTDVAAAPGAAAQVEFRAQHADGHWIWLESVGRNLTDHPGVNGILVTSRDATERHNLQEQFLQAQRMEVIGRLAGGVAHDFNNLLTAIIGYTELSLSDLPSQSPIASHLCTVRTAAQRAADLTAQLLTFARKQVTVLRSVCVNEMVEEAISVFVRLLGDDVELVTDLAPEAGYVRADPSQLQQVFVNLALNARDAMPGGGRLTIATRTEPGDPGDTRPAGQWQAKRYVIVSVIDTGVGMDEAVRQHIFEPFYTTKEEGKGTGLGLATSHGIVTQAGGRIEVESQVGKGTTFRVYLPAIRTELGNDQPRALGEEAGGGTETILLVEDDDDVRGFAAQALRQLGYRLLVARDGIEALKLADEHDGKIDLLLTDLVMPNMSGAALAQHLLADRPDTRIIFSSGYAPETILKGVPLRDRAALLQKPYPSSVLAQAVRDALDPGKPAGSAP